MRKIIMEYLPDHSYLTQCVQQLFPCSSVIVTYPFEEVINIQIDDRLFVFEVGSEDESYIFDDGRTTFTIPLMENPEGV